MDACLYFSYIGCENLLIQSNYFLLLSKNVLFSLSVCVIVNFHAAQPEKQTHIVWWPTRWLEGCNGAPERSGCEHEFLNLNN